MEFRPNVRVLLVTDERRAIRKCEILCNGVVDCSSLPHLQVRSAESYSPNHLYSHTD